ncbi:TfoX family protein [Streptomyces vinaceus]|uniref:TfoX family protein n=1 Tax=Streptomyces vinaceus TaxID=1960 RepID=A0A5J6JLL7_STRVI|nr:TfoX/Sxy family protein [Streptomyces vinaceus]QEV49384.1 TfoX family protein [Streptomyces vinaceus]GHE44978.1 RNA methyltransferase [Streptomyces vinaceus]
MAYDEVLAERVRELLEQTEETTVKKMFGGLVFTVQGNTVVGVVGDELLVRVAPDDTEQALAQPGARPFEVRGRISKGWVTVAGEVLDDHVLNSWLQLGRRAAAALPPK